MSESQARRIIHRLIDDGWLEVVGNESGGAPKASRRYLLNLGRLTPGASARGGTDARGRTAARDPLHRRAKTGVIAVTPEPSLNRQEQSEREERLSLTQEGICHQPGNRRDELALAELAGVTPDIVREAVEAARRAAPRGTAWPGVTLAAARKLGRVNTTGDRRRSTRS